MVENKIRRMIKKHTNLGLKGGSILRAWTSSQLQNLKNECVRMGMASATP